MVRDKTPHTPFDDMLKPKPGLHIPRKWLRLRRYISPISSYGLTFALGAVFVFAGSVALHRKFPLPAMPTPLPTAVVPVQHAYASLAPRPVVAPLPTPVPRETPTPLAAALPEEQPATPSLTPRRVRRARPRTVRSADQPRRIETALSQLPPIRIPNISTRRRHRAETETPPARYDSASDPVVQALDHRRDALDGVGFKDETRDSSWDEERDQRRSHLDEDFDSDRDPGPADEDSGGDDAEDFPVHHWGRAGGREKKWKWNKKWRDGW